jgi:hypothetical protein
LRHEIEAYQDFQRFRARLLKQSGAMRNPQQTAARLDQRRTQLMARMRRRRA